MKMLWKMFVFCNTESTLHILTVMYTTLHVSATKCNSMIFIAEIPTRMPPGWYVSIFQTGQTTVSNLVAFLHVPKWIYSAQPQYKLYVQKAVLGLFTWWYAPFVYTFHFPALCHLTMPTKLEICPATTFAWFAGPKRPSNSRAAVITENKQFNRLLVSKVWQSSNWTRVIFSLTPRVAPSGWLWPLYFCWSSHATQIFNTIINFFKHIPEVLLIFFCLQTKCTSDALPMIPITL